MYTEPPTPQLKAIEVAVTVTYTMRITSYAAAVTPLELMQQEKILAEIDEYRWVWQTMSAEPDITMAFIREVV